VLAPVQFASRLVNSMMKIEPTHIAKITHGKSTAQFALQIFRKMLQKPDAIFSLTVALLLGVPQFGSRLPNSMIGQLNFADVCNIE